MICPSCKADVHPAQELVAGDMGGGDIAGGGGFCYVCPKCGANMGACEGSRVHRSKGGSVALHERVAAANPGDTVELTNQQYDQLAIAGQQAPPPHLPRNVTVEQLAALLASAMRPPEPPQVVAGISGPVGITRPSSTAMSLREQAQQRLEEVEAQIEALSALKQERDELRKMLGMTAQPDVVVPLKRTND